MFRFVSLCLLVACGGSGLSPVDDAERPDRTPADAFDEAVEESDVPFEILMAIAWAETGIQMVEGEVEFPGRPAAFGVMGLRGAQLREGARLAGVDVEDAKYRRNANIRAAAAILDQLADEEDIDRAYLGAWAPVVARYSGIEEERARLEYVHYEVYGALRKGIEVEGVSIPPTEAMPDLALPPQERATGDGGAIWTPSPNHSSRGGRSVDYVVIHTCEGSYSGCWGWLTNGNSGVSAHYVVNSTGSQVRHLVDEDRKAWHIAADYDCSRNGGQDCGLNGVNMNSLSVGIEHAGYGSQSSWDPSLIARSAALTCGVTQRHGIPQDSYHIVGHGQMQPWNRSDPGANWPWASYLAQVQSACGGASSPPTSTPPPTSSTPTTPPVTTPPSNGSATSTAFVIDSNNGYNQTSDWYVEVPGSWWASANVSGYYNTGYWVAPTAPVSDPLSFWFKTDQSRCYQVDAWWTAASDRPHAIAYLGWNASEVEVGRKTVDQTASGSRWNRLGTWQFGAGWNRVLLSRWAATGDYVIGDAVRLTPVSCN